MFIVWNWSGDARERECENFQRLEDLCDHKKKVFIDRQQQNVRKSFRLEIHLKTF